MKTVFTTVFSLLVTLVIQAQTYLKLPEAPTSGTTSSGVVFDQTPPQTFTHGGRVLNIYGFGFQTYNDGVTNGLGGYASGWEGFNVYTEGALRLRIMRNGNALFSQSANIDGELKVFGGSAITATSTATSPGGSWDYSLNVGNFSSTTNTYARINFLSGSSGLGGITMQRKSTYEGDMFLQVRKDAGYYITPVLIKSTGLVGINTDAPDESLTVRGTIHTHEVRVDSEAEVVPDYVFNDDYQLRTLDDVAKYVKEFKHLPEVPSSKEIEANGLKLKEMNLLLLKKIEELTLYQIEAMSQIQEMKKELELLKKN